MSVSVRVCVCMKATADFIAFLYTKHATTLLNLGFT